MDDFDRPNAGDEQLNKPIPFDDSEVKTDVSHSPLSIGGGQMSDTARRPAAPAGKGQTEKIVSSAERITGMKTFFAKLHPGAMGFLDEQITNWLDDNQGITIKHTNTTVGEVQAKKTEPNIIITVWY